MFKNVGEIYKKLDNFTGEAWSLIEKLRSDEADVNDWAKMRVIHTRMVWGILRILDDYCEFKNLLHYFENKIENEKDWFGAQKIEKRFEDGIKKDIDYTIEFLRIHVKFEDYRCIDFQKRLTEFMCNVKVFFWDEE